MLILWGEMREQCKKGGSAEMCQTQAVSFATERMIGWLHTKTEKQMEKLVFTPANSSSLLEFFVLLSYVFFLVVLLLHALVKILMQWYI